MTEEPTDQPYDTLSKPPLRTAEEDGQREGIVYMMADTSEGVMRHLPVGSEEWWAAATAARLIQRTLDTDVFEVASVPTVDEWAQVATAAGATTGGELAGIDDEIKEIRGYTPDDETNEDLVALHARRAIVLIAHAECAPDPAMRASLIDDAVEAAGDAADWAGEGDDWRDRYDEKVEEATEALVELHDGWRTWNRRDRLTCLSRVVAHPDGATRDDLNEHGWSGAQNIELDWLLDNGMIERFEVDGQGRWRLTAKGLEYLGALSYELDQMPPAQVLGTCPKCGHPALLVIELDAPEVGPYLAHPVQKSGRVAYYTSCPVDEQTEPAAFSAPPPPPVRPTLPAAPVEVNSPEQLLAVLKAKQGRIAAEAESAGDAQERLRGELADVADLAEQCRVRGLTVTHIGIVASLEEPTSEALTAATSAAAAAQTATAAAAAAVGMASKHVGFAAQGAAGTFYQGAA